MKKVTVLNASPKKDGATAGLLAAFMAHCPYSAVYYNMYDEAIAPCIDCGKCKPCGKCFMRDADPVLGDILSSDFVVIASPVYNYSFPAPMKAFLDRLQPFYYRWNEKKGETERKGFLLVTSGRSGKLALEIMEKQGLTALRQLSCELSGSYLIAETDKKNTLHPDEECKVKSLAYEFFNPTP